MKKNLLPYVCFALCFMAVSCQEKTIKELKINSYKTSSDSDGKIRYTHTSHSFSIAIARKDWSVVSDKDGFILGHGDTKNIYGIYFYFGEAASEQWGFWKNSLTLNKGTFAIDGLDSFSTRETKPSHWVNDNDESGEPYCESYKQFLYQDKPVPVFIQITPLIYPGIEVLLADRNAMCADDVDGQARETASIRQAREIIKTIRYEGPAVEFGGHHTD
ncbi:MAG: hypothetical protein AABZ44_05065 [Elusimicrobiota bacterium]